jgi:prepilin-type N-terminal cleavage/methylation domain-containing protein
MLSHRRHAFTLVELLVVIGIIAVLIAILLPTLARARESAQRTACLSNMRELSTMLRMYSTQFKDAFPIGYMDQKEFSYIINWCNAGSNPPKPSQMGLIVVAGLVKNPKTYYCPSEKQDPQFQYLPNPPGGFSTNPWPFLTTPTSGGHTRLGYSCRPIANWPPNTRTNPVTGQAYPLSDSRAWLPIDTRGNLYVPKFSKLGSVAILADTNYCQQKIIQRHKTGLNVLYSNGGAHWVPLKAILKRNNIPTPWVSVTEATAFPSDASNNDIYLADGTWTNFSTPGSLLPKARWSGLWIDLDRQ